MRFLADTHVLLWAALQPERLSATATRALLASDSEVYFSFASAWEMAIKLSLGKLALPIPLGEFVKSLREQGFRYLPPRLADAETIASLPLHHRDPFDRLLIAQAMQANLRLLSADPAFSSYDIRRVW